MSSGVFWHISKEAEGHTGVEKQRWCKGICIWGRYEWGKITGKFAETQEGIYGLLFSDTYV